VGAHLVVIMAARKTRTVARRRCRLNRTIRLAAVMAATHTLIRQRKTKGLQHDTEAYSDRSDGSGVGGSMGKTRERHKALRNRTVVLRGRRSRPSSRAIAARHSSRRRRHRQREPAPSQAQRTTPFQPSLLHHRIGEEEGDGVRLLVVVGASDALDCCSWRRLVAAQRGMSVRLRQTGRPVARVKRDAISSYISSLLLRIKIPSTPSRIIWSTTESG
jgi:hypothetical protein